MSIFSFNKNALKPNRENPLKLYKEELEKKLEYPKQNILGIYDINPEAYLKLKPIAKSKQTVSTINPTFLTSFKLI